MMDNILAKKVELPIKTTCYKLQLTKELLEAIFILIFFMTLLGLTNTIGKEYTV